MWIAKNSITGKEYGKKYSSVYDCQKFIDTDLIVLEYEMQKVFALEDDILRRIKNENKSFLAIIQSAIDSFAIDTGFKDDIKTICEFTLQGKSQQDLDRELHNLACARWQRNNIIRCYNVSQNRYADGFDF